MHTLARRSLRVVFLSLLTLVVALPVAAAQAGLSGTVQDETGLPLPAASVEVRDADGGLLGRTLTRPDGSWTLTSIPPGDVVITIAFPGFRVLSIDLLAADRRPGSISSTLLLGGFADDVSVTASREARELAAIPSAVGVLSGAVIRETSGVNLAETLKFVPGVAAGDVSGVDDLRISIRGAGVRAGFGSRGVLLMTDGFPVTEPDGQTPHFDGQIDLANAERIEVVKGPSSALYGGAALGGVVNVVTRAPARDPSLSVRAEAGGFRYAKLYAAGSAGVGPMIIGGTLGRTHLDGFRAHNSLSDVAGTARADYSDGTNRVTLSFLGTDADLELPGSLNREQFETDRSQTRDQYIVNDWGRENRLFRFGGRYERQLGEGQSLEVDSYGQTRDLFHPIFVVIDQEARRYVGHARYRITRGAHRVTAGVDVDRQAVDDRWFVNAGGTPSFPIRDDDNSIVNMGYYAQDEVTLGAGVTMVAGVRADRITYDLVDQRTSDGDASDRRAFTRVSPKVGVTGRLSDALVAYGNVATGFEAPTLGEVRLPAGFNTTVKPQTAVSVEGGLRGQLRRASFDVAVYRMAVTDEILPETIDDVTVYRNVAKATHSGVELSVRYQPRATISVDATYAYSRFVLAEFGEFSGNRLPGIPAQMGTVRASYSESGWNAGLALTWAGEAFVNDANDEAAPAYGVLSGQLAYQLGRARLFLRGENLGDVTYTSRAQVNDSGGFFYYPAPGRVFRVGTEVRW